MGPLDYEMVSDTGASSEDDLQKTKEASLYGYKRIGGLYNKKQLLQKSILQNQFGNIFQDQQLSPPDQV